MRDVGLVAKERIGTAVGPYRLLRLIGSGAMGVVFEAEHEEIGQHAAVKLLLGASAQGSRYVRRFLREARAACAVRHPGLVQIFDCGVLEDQTPYLLMEFVDGESLRVHLSGRGQLTVEEATSIARQLASTLVTLHARAIVHRDIKPENVLLVKDDAIPGRTRAKLIDFGIARFGTEEGERVTEDGAVVGTPHYMAPEQCVPDGVLASGTDIYALGVLLFEMLTGELPFTGDMATVMRRHVMETPSFERLDGVPNVVRQLVEAMLAKDPARRPAAVEMLGQLGRTSSHPVAFLTTELRGTPPPLALPASQSAAPAVRLPSKRTVAALLLAASALGFLAWRTTHPHRPAMAMSGMVRLNGGKFTMGNSAAERAAECAKLGGRCSSETLDREQPPHDVRLSPFLLDVNETTNAEFLRWEQSERTVIRPDGETHEPRYIYDETDTVLLMDTAPAWGFGGFRVQGTGVVVVPGYEDKPVVQITWDAARRYCAWRGKRLPTEAEMNFAAAGSTRRRFPWGEAEPRCDGVVYARLEPEDECFGAPTGAQPVTAGAQDWTPEGVHGLGGNVAEWVEDAFPHAFYGECGACVDPVQQPTPGATSEFRIVRGGSWSSTLNLVRSAGRSGWDRRSLASSIGVRCALADTP